MASDLEKSRFPKVLALTLNGSMPSAAYAPNRSSHCHAQFEDLDADAVLWSLECRSVA
jgi:hypothetical protein